MSIVTINIEVALARYDVDGVMDELDRLKDFFTSSARGKQFFSEECQEIDFEITDISTPDDEDSETSVGQSQHLFVNFTVSDDSEIKPSDFDYDETNRGWVEGVIEVSLSNHLKKNLH